MFYVKVLKQNCKKAKTNTIISIKTEKIGKKDSSELIGVKTLVGHMIDQQMQKNQKMAKPIKNRHIPK